MDFTVIQANKELRACARQQLQGVWGKMAFTFFVYFLVLLPCQIFSTLDSLNQFIPEIPSFSVISTLSAIALYIILGPFSLGFASYFLKRIRGEDIATRNIFEGFKRFLPSFLAELLTILFTVLWSLLLIIPGIIKALGYSMVFYIMHDNPEIKPLEALKRSQIMMKGYKWKLFTLQLSFIGWAFLALLTLGIGIFWLNPYIYLSTANFYENLKKNQEKALMENAKTETTQNLA
jgi:uncharacterized membrane protein